MDFNSDFMPQFLQPIQWQADCYFPILQRDFPLSLFCECFRSFSISWVKIAVLFGWNKNIPLCFATHYIFRYWWGEIGYFPPQLCFNSPISIFMNITRNSSGGRGKLTKHFWLLSITCCCVIFKSLLILLKSMDG